MTGTLRDCTAHPKCWRNDGREGYCTDAESARLDTSTRPSATRTVTIAVGTGRGTDRRKAEVSVVNGHVWVTFLGPQGGRQYTLPLSVDGSATLGRTLSQAAAAIRGFNR